MWVFISTTGAKLNRTIGYIVSEVQLTLYLILVYRTVVIFHEQEHGYAECWHCCNFRRSTLFSEFQSEMFLLYIVLRGKVILFHMHRCKKPITVYITFCLKKLPLKWWNFSIMTFPFISTTFAASSLRKSGYSYRFS